MLGTLLVINKIAVGTTSLGDRMNSAALNTLVGMIVVFAVLIIISFLISLFKYIPRLFGNDTVSRKESEEIVIHTTDSDYLEDHSEDEELVAVIMAAIYASMNENNEYIPEDGLVVRSIRKVNRRIARY